MLFLPNPLFRLSRSPVRLSRISQIRPLPPRRRRFGQPRRPKCCDNLRTSNRCTRWGWLRDGPVTGGSSTKGWDTGHQQLVQSRKDWQAPGQAARSTEPGWELRPRRCQGGRGSGGWLLGLLPSERHFRRDQATEPAELPLETLLPDPGLLLRRKPGVETDLASRAPLPISETHVTGGTSPPPEAGLQPPRLRTQDPADPHSRPPAIVPANPLSPAAPLLLCCQNAAKRPRPIGKPPLKLTVGFPWLFKPNPNSSGGPTRPWGRSPCAHWVPGTMLCDGVDYLLFNPQGRPMSQVRRPGFYTGANPRGQVTSQGRPLGGEGTRLADSAAAHVAPCCAVPLSRAPGVAPAPPLTTDPRPPLSLCSRRCCALSCLLTFQPHGPFSGMFFLIFLPKSCLLILQDKSFPSRHLP